jgi:hypothetical protein
MLPIDKAMGKHTHTFLVRMQSYVTLLKENLAILCKIIYAYTFDLAILPLEI